MSDLKAPADSMDHDEIAPARAEHAEGDVVDNTAATGSPSAARSRRLRRARWHGGWRLLLARLGLLVAVVASWQGLTSAGVLDPFFFSRPSDIFGRAYEWFSTGYIWPHLLTTLEETALGFAIGTALGLLAGFVLARFVWVAEVVDPFLKALNALPRVVLAPIFLLWFGLGMASKVALAVSVVFFIVFFNTYRGLKEVDPVRLANVHMLGANELQKLRHVYLPSVLTWIFSSLHIAIGFALTGAVVGEYLGANSGVGYVIARAEGTFDTTGVFAGMLVLTVAVVIIDILVSRLEEHLVRWQPPTHRTTDTDVA